MSGFTPGPWGVWSDLDVVALPSCDVVALTKSGDRMANARLIAAAPETHIAALNLLASIDPDTLNPEQFLVWCSLQDATSKARGDQ